MPPLLDLAFQRPELGSHPFRVGNPLQLETPCLGLRADMREAKELERLRLANSSPLAVRGGVPPELDQPRLLGVQLQGELGEPAAKVCPEPLGVIPVLESDHQVVRETHDHNVTMCVAASPLVGP